MRPDAKMSHVLTEFLPEQTRREITMKNPIKGVLLHEIFVISESLFTSHAIILCCYMFRNVDEKCAPISLFLCE